jgi:hypothetical protein
MATRERVKNTTGASGHAWFPLRPMVSLIVSQTATVCLPVLQFLSVRGRVVALEDKRTDFPGHVDREQR